MPDSRATCHPSLFPGLSLPIMTDNMSRTEANIGKWAAKTSDDDAVDRPASARNVAGSSYDSGL
jgi:hypothetical protein